MMNKVFLLMFLVSPVFAARGVVEINYTAKIEGDKGVTSPIPLIKLEDFSDLVHMSHISDFYLIKREFGINNFEMVPLAKYVSSRIDSAYTGNLRLTVDFNQRALVFDQQVTTFGIEPEVLPPDVVHPWKLSYSLSSKAKYEIRMLLHRLEELSVNNILKAFNEAEIDGFTKK